MSLCQFKDILGKPGEGVHSYRIANIAIVDLLLTIAAAIVVSRLFNWSFWITLGCLILIGIILHRLFCVRTTIDKLLFRCSC